MLTRLLSNRKVRDELDDAFYSEFPEEWEQGELFLDGPAYPSILAGDTDRCSRPRREGEEVAEENIWRAGRKVWTVGRVYSVRSGNRTEVSSKTVSPGEGRFTDTYTIEQAGGTVIGKLRLVEIKPDKRWFRQQRGDVLVFEVVKE